MDFLRHVDGISMDLPIFYYKRPQVENIMILFCREDCKQHIPLCDILPGSSLLQNYLVAGIQNNQA